MPYERCNARLQASENGTISPFAGDLQFWRNQKNNCGLGVYVTVMEFIYTHLKLMRDVPSDSLLGKAFRSRHLLKSQEHVEAFNAMHDYVLRGQGATTYKFLSYCHMLDMHPHFVGNDSALVASVFECHIAVNSCTGDFGRPTKRHYPARCCSGQSGDVGVVLRDYVRRVQGPIPAVIHVNVRDECIVTRVRPRFRVVRFDTETGLHVEHWVSYRFCALILCNGYHFEAVLDFPAGSTWAYDSLEENGPNGELAPRQRIGSHAANQYANVWPDQDYLTRGFTVDQCVFVLVDDVPGRRKASPVMDAALTKAYTRNMEYMERLTSPFGFRLVVNPTATDDLRAQAEILADEVLIGLGTYGHKIHTPTDARWPVMEYWLYEGVSSDQSNVARFTPATYSLKARSAFKDIRGFVERGSLGECVIDGTYALRTAGFLIENTARKVLRTSDPRYETGMTEREKWIQANHRAIGGTAALEHRTGRHAKYAWPKTGMVRPNVSPPGYLHVDNGGDERAASLNVVIILTECGHLTEFFHLDDWAHGSEGFSQWSREPPSNTYTAFCGGTPAGCLSHTYFSSHRPHRAAAPPFRTPVVKMWLTYHLVELPYSPERDKPRFSSRALPSGEAPQVFPVPTVSSCAPFIEVAALTDPLTIPYVRRVWAKGRGWPDGRVARDDNGGNLIWHDALLTEADSTMGRRMDSVELGMTFDDVCAVLGAYGLDAHIEVDSTNPGL